MVAAHPQTCIFLQFHDAHCGYSNWSRMVGGARRPPCHGVVALVAPSGSGCWDTSGLPPLQPPNQSVRAHKDQSGPARYTPKLPQTRLSRQKDCFRISLNELILMCFCIFQNIFLVFSRALFSSTGCLRIFSHTMQHQIVQHCCIRLSRDKFQIGLNLDLSKDLNNRYRPLFLN